MIIFINDAFIASRVFSRNASFVSQYFLMLFRFTLLLLKDHTWSYCKSLVEARYSWMHSLSFALSTSGILLQNVTQWSPTGRSRHKPQNGPLPSISIHISPDRARTRNTSVSNLKIVRSKGNGIQWTPIRVASPLLSFPLIFVSRHFSPFPLFCQ